MVLVETVVMACDIEVVVVEVVVLVVVLVVVDTCVGWHRTSFVRMVRWEGCSWWRGVWRMWMVVVRMTTTRHYSHS